MVADGRLDEALTVLEGVRSNSAVLGGLHALINAQEIEVLYLLGRLSEIKPVVEELNSHATDPRYTEETTMARAIAIHSAGECTGECVSLAAEYDAAEAKGGRLTAVVGRVKFGVLALQHGLPTSSVNAIEAIAAAQDLGIWPSLRPWLRRFAPYGRSLVRRTEGAGLVASLAAWDPDGWRSALVDGLPGSKGNTRLLLLRAISRTANRDTLVALSGLGGADVAALRRQLRYLQAPRLFLRTLGGVELRRGSWDGPSIQVEKKRARMLLAVLAAHLGTPLTRDLALDILWPDAEPELAINSLNQTVFQLRRYIDASYRGGESPEYIVSTAEQVGLNPDLVRTDLVEIRRLPGRLATVDWHHRQTFASRAVQLVRGEFLADLRYEDWASRQQLAVHREVRDRLLPIAQAPATTFRPELAAQAASALLLLDPFDEQAVLALAGSLSESGQRAAARQVVLDFLNRLNADLDLEPTNSFRVSASKLDPRWVNERLTPSDTNQLRA